MRDWKEALSAFLERVQPGRFDKTEVIPVGETLGRVTGTPIFARISSPHYHCAAMDGVAVKAEDTFGAAEDNPRRLRVGGKAVYVDTGDPLPAGTNAVIMIEEVHQHDKDTIEVLRAAHPWQHVRTVGEDFVASELILPQGHRISPYDMGALLAGGVIEVTVKQKPKILVVPTGNEIISPREASSRGLRPGDIVDFNSTIFAGLIEQAGATCIGNPPVPDAPNELERVIAGAAREGFDIIIINAGSSAGSEDYTPGIVEKLGEVVAHGVAIMPGKPTLLGVIDTIPVIGLPGYPVSAVVSFDLFVQPLLAAMLGTSMPGRRTLRVTPARRIVSRLGVEEFVRVGLGRVGRQVIATPLPRGAGVVSSLTKADGIIRIPSLTEGIEEGQDVEAELLADERELDNKIVLVGSHDVALDLLASWLRVKDPSMNLCSTHVGSLGGIVALKKGYCHAAGSHLLDPPSGEYNMPFIHRYLEGVEVRVIQFALRQQGLILPVGNPRNLNSIGDLRIEGIRFINRQRGSGTRVLLDYLIEREGIDSDAIDGYDAEEFSHLGVAVAVASGRADVGMGIYAAAKALGCDFVPVEQERYDLIVPMRYLDDPKLQLLMSVLRCEDFRTAVEDLGGYDCGRMGEVLA
jgi:putative molybdopterin biosynthesis protein